MAHAPSALSRAVRGRLGGSLGMVTRGILSQINAGSTDPDPPTVGPAYYGGTFGDNSPADVSHGWNNFAWAMTRGDWMVFDCSVTRRTRGDDDANGNPTFTTVAQNLAGGELWITGKRSLADADSAAVFRCNTLTLGGVEVLSNTLGTGRLTLTPERTEGEASDEETLYVDCVWVDSEGRPHTFQKGRLTIWADATTAV